MQLNPNRIKTGKARKKEKDYIFQGKMTKKTPILILKNNVFYSEYRILDPL